MQENIRKSDYILLIGTERFKARIEEDRLYKTSRDSFNAYKKLFATSEEICVKIYKSFGQGKAVILIEEQGTNFIAFIENGKVLLEIPIPQEIQSEFSRIRWLPKDSLGIYVAELSKAVYEIIDQAKKEVNFKLSAKPIGNSVTNVAFEFGFALEKKEHHPDAIIPLLYSGDFRTSFPNKIFDILIRDMRDANNYYDLLIGLNNPLRIIPAMCTELARSEQYKVLLSGQNPDKPEVKFGRRGGEGVMHNANINSQGLVTLDLSISSTELTNEQELGRGGGYGIVYLDDNYILGINFAWFRGGGRLNAAPHTATKDNINRVFTAVTGIWEIGGWERADRAALSELLRVRVEQVRTMLERKPLSKPNNSTRFSL